MLQDLATQVLWEVLMLAKEVLYLLARLLTLMPPQKGRQPVRGEEDASRLLQFWQDVECWGDILGRMSLTCVLAE